jgi:hypothetical protein
MDSVGALRRYGPVGLVPLAWSFTAAAVFTPLVTERTLTIALGVMSVIFAVFAPQREMGEGLLRIWRAVLVAGLAVTLVGLGDLLLTPADPLLWVTLYGWMVIPTAGLAWTGLAGAPAPRLYLSFAAVSAAGLLLFALAGGPPATPALTPGAGAGLVVLAAGHTAGVALAALQNDG